MEQTPHPPAVSHRWQLGLAVLILCLTAGGGYWIWRDQNKLAAKTTTASSSASLTYSLDSLSDTDQGTIKAVLNEFATQEHLTLEPSGSGDIAIKPGNSDASFSTAPTGSPQPIAQGEVLKPSSQHFVVDSPKLTSQQKTALARTIQSQLDNLTPSWTYLALGDIIPARDVYTYSKKQGFTYPFTKVADRTKQADLTVANLETTVADGQAFLEGEGVLNFTAPQKALQGLTLAGIDGVNLANNHSMNGGASKVSEMLANLKAAGIGSFGVSSSNSPRSWSTSVKGIRISHLGYDTVPGNIEPTASTPGAHRIPLAPWGTLTDADIAAVQADIRQAKLSADVVIPWFHWGTEYTHDANAQQRRLAQACIDAGAEVVIGTHPHWTQGMELYKGHLIAYSLGNFVFDQNWSEETKRSTALELGFSGTHVTSATLLPAKIDNWVQPHFLAPSDALYSQILQDISAHSWWPRT